MGGRGGPAPAPPRFGEPPRSNLDALNGKGELILVVDDEPFICSMARRVLVRAGYRVVLAGHGEEALVRVAQHRGEVSLVLTDMNMPIMDGPALLLALEATAPALPVIGSSGLDPTGGFAGLRHFLSKPYTPELLLAAVRTALEDGR